MMKRVLVLLLCILLTFSALNGCAAKSAPAVLPDGEDAQVKALVLYDSSAGETFWEETYYYLSQSLALNVEVECADAAEDCSLEGYDVVYPDVSIMHSEKAEDVKAALIRFVENGGGLFLENAFHSFFDAGFIGAEEFVKIEEYPAGLNFPSLGDDLGEIQSILSDFSGLYDDYANFDALSQCDYGYAVKLGSAKALVTFQNHALYTMNEYGEGYVFFTNPLLPNRFSASGFTMLAESEETEPFASTTASCNQLLFNSFASYISKQQYGYSLSRVFGSFGRPSMAWELHFEEITGFENDAAIVFSELCKEYLQVPSYSIVRSSYWWFLRAESVTYLLNESANGGFDYSMDIEESAYSSGTHVVSGDKWLSLSEIKEGNSYFEDYPEFTMRAYPFAADLDGDGVLDIVCGSEDGKFYFYTGESDANRLKVSDAAALKDSAGSALSVNGYSSPVLADVDGDGIFDLISGDENGSILFFAGLGDQTFQSGKKLLSTPLSGQALPELADMNGDGVLDLLVGSNEGRLLLYYGTEDEKGSVQFQAGNGKELSSACAELGTWLAPRAVDLNGDGSLDIAVGTFDGYVAKLLRNGGDFVFKDFFTNGEPNYKGNCNIKFGNNCVPFFVDIDGDGALDLLCGSLEYGLCYPIDSEYFPYREELQAQVDYIKERGFYIGAHFYTNEYSSKEREAYELERHKEAMESYGIDTSFIGANQHTWHTSKVERTQTMASLYDAGFLWQSGFKAPCSSATPQVSAENVISLPFFLMADGEETLLIQNNSTLLYDGVSRTDLSAKYDMPMCMYYHCDFVYENQDGARASIQTAEDFRSAHSYNVVMENQMMRQIAAAYNLNVSLQNGTAAEAGKLDIVVSPSEISKDSKLYDEGYQNSCGVKITFGQKYDASKMAVDADVWYREGNAIYFAANRDVEIYETNGGRDAAHIEQINIAARIAGREDGAEIEFLDGGMMQLVVSGKADTDSPGWTVTENGGKTMFTKYGEAETLNITF